MGKRVQQYHYRSVAVELGPNRFSRDTWILEPWFQRDGMRRSTEGKFKLHPVAKPKPTKQGPVARHRPEDMAPSRGLYEVTRITDVTANGGFQVVAKCTGLYCGGRTRTFQSSDWGSSKVRVRGCTACVAQLRREERLAAKRLMGIS